MSGEEPGLLGNLPRSRPGRRSQKRPAAPAAATPPRTEVKRADGDDGDPVGDVLRVAARTAEAGLRAASDVTREVLRRLPRP